MLCIGSMRIAMISTPFVPVPPPRYGGTELIVAELVQGLAAAGHQVTLFATGDSAPPSGVRLRSRFAEPVWPPDAYAELDHVAFAVEELLLAGEAFDLVHAHVPAALPFAKLLPKPLVYTVHHDNGVEYARLRSLYQRCSVHFVAISERQRQLIPELAEASVVHHGIGAAPLGAGRGGYCAFLGRFAREKGVHWAIDAAQAARLPIRLGGGPHWRDRDYFVAEVAPRLSLPGVVSLGEVGGRKKEELLGEARALLFPIDWEEPFGLVMIEAMLMGTPVLAFGRGAVPEVVEEGVTGFVCRDLSEMVARLTDLGQFDRPRCRRRALERWTTPRMVRDYMTVYERVQGWIGNVEAVENHA